MVIFGIWNLVSKGKHCTSFGQWLLKDQKTWKRAACEPAELLLSLAGNEDFSFRRKVLIATSF